MWWSSTWSTPRPETLPPDSSPCKHPGSTCNQNWKHRKRKHPKMDDTNMIDLCNRDNMMLCFAEKALCIRVQVCLDPTKTQIWIWTRATLRSKLQTTKSKTSGRYKPNKLCVEVSFDKVDRRVVCLWQSIPVSQQRQSLNWLCVKLEISNIKCSRKHTN